MRSGPGRRRPRENAEPDGGRRRRVLRGCSAFGVLVFVWACASVWQPPVLEPRHRVEPIAGAGSTLGSATCLECHDSFDAHFVESPFHGDCESCHGPGELHVHTVQADAIRFPSSADCIICHGSAQRTLVHWDASPHAEVGVLCSDCHASHVRTPDLLRAPSQLDTTLLRHASAETKLCATCHPGVVGQLGLPSHHPVKEGMLDCTSCHSPHARDGALAGGRNQVCAECHEEVFGPWVFEHPPVNEDCGYCHVPHGAPNESLLEVSQPGVCLSCHTLAEAGAVHQPWALSTACTDCHSAVHGSYTDPHLRR